MNENSPWKWIATVLGAVCALLIILGGFLPMVQAAFNASQEITYQRLLDYWAGQGYVAYSAPTGDVTFTNNITVTNNASVGGTLYAKTGRAATYVIATSDASALLKAQADYVLTGANDQTTILTAINALQNVGGITATVKKGQIKIVGTVVTLGALMDFPTTQAFVFDAEGTIWTGGGIRIDSAMNCVFHFGQITGTTGGTCLELNPRTSGPDDMIAFNAVVVHLDGLGGTGTKGVSWNNTAADFYGNTLQIDEWSTTAYTTTISMAAADIPRNKIVVPIVPAVRLTNNADQDLADSTSVNVTFNVDTYDYLAMHSTSVNTSRVFVQIPGEYTFGACVKWSVNSTGTRELAIYLNGTTNLAETRMVANSGGLYDFQTISGSYILQAGDYIELRALQRAGGTESILTDGIVSPSFWAYKVN